MFNTKDRQVVEICIEFNITAIIDWLKSGGKFEDIDQIKREEFGSWGNATTQKYLIDMIPIGKNSNVYYHRRKNLISQNISGIDFLGTLGEETKFFLKRAGVQALEWRQRKGSLLLMIHTEKGGELILTTPLLTEVVELETKGGLSNPGSLQNEDQKMKTAVSFNQDGTPREYMEIWRGSASSQSLGYGNGLGHISFSTLNFQVEY